MGAKIYNTTTPKVDHCIGYVDDDGTIYSDNTRIIGRWIGFVDASTGKVYDSTTPKVDHCIGCVAPDGKLYRDSVPDIGNDIGYVSPDGTIYSDNTAIVGHWIGYVDSTSVLGKGAACFFILKGLLGSNRYAAGEEAESDTGAKSAEQTGSSTGSASSERASSAYGEKSKSAYDYAGAKDKSQSTGPRIGFGAVGVGLVVLLLLYLFFGETWESIKRDPGLVKWILFAVFILAFFGGLGYYLRRKYGTIDMWFANRKSSRTGQTGWNSTSFTQRNKTGQTQQNKTAGAQQKQTNVKGSASEKKTLFGTMKTYQPGDPEGDALFEEMFQDVLPKEQTYVYYTCTCGQKMRFPSGRGQIEFTCPKCKRVGRMFTGEKK